jgi:hypothetical protein
VTALLLAGTLFVGGLVVTFAGSRARGRVVGFALMAAGSATVLAAGAPQAASWWLIGPAVITLVAMLALARSLARQLAADDGANADLDDHRW